MQMALAIEENNDIVWFLYPYAHVYTNNQPLDLSDSGTKSESLFQMKSVRAASSVLAGIVHFCGLSCLHVFNIQQPV